MNKTTQRIIAIFFLLLILGSGLIFFLKKDSGPPFRKDDVLILIDGKTNEEIVTIDIEIADEFHEREQGLMYRTSMPENAGMLFVFSQASQLAFWMKNTKLPLDIIYLDQNGVIVDMYENTTPMSEKQLPARKPAMYVLEVNGGFTKAHGLELGDRISND